MPARRAGICTPKRAGAVAISSQGSKSRRGLGAAVGESLMDMMARADRRNEDTLSPLAHP
jgi:hypothetical protein